jgi:hypothetical protein
MLPELFVLLYAGHLTADYALQTDHQAEHKAAAGAAGWRANLAHASTHLVVASIMLVVGHLVVDLPIPALPALAALTWITTTHAILDRRWPVTAWMRIARQQGWAQRGGAAHVDQTAHVLVLLVAALALSAI